MALLMLPLKEFISQHNYGQLNNPNSIVFLNISNLLSIKNNPGAVLTYHLSKLLYVIET